MERLTDSLRCVLYIREALVLWSLRNIGTVNFMFNSLKWKMEKVCNVDNWEILILQIPNEYW